MSEFPLNIVNSVGAPLAAQGETLFLTRLFTELRHQMGDGFDRLTFVVHRRVFGEFAGTPIPLDPGNSDRVLIIIADEKEAFPCHEFLSYRAIFRAYGNPDGSVTRIHPFPVGYHNAVGQVESIEFTKRTIPVFFSGYLNRNRLDLFKQLRPIWWLPKRNLKNRYVKELARRAVEKLTKQRDFPDVILGGKITFTEWFGKGLPPDDYAKTLANTKIALCPPGFVSHETIRHWEAMRLGCVIISAPLPPNRFYKNSPIIQLNDWSQLKPLLDSLLSDPERLQQLHYDMSSWWKEVCGEEAVAREITRILSESQVI